MLKKIIMACGAVVAGMATVFGVYFATEKHREKEVGGKLMRVQYRFTKEFDD